MYTQIGLQSYSYIIYVFVWGVSDTLQTYTLLSNSIPTTYQCMVINLILHQYISQGLIILDKLILKYQPRLNTSDICQQVLL